MYKKFRKITSSGLLALLIFLLAPVYAQDILFITPTQGVQGTNDLTVTLIATGVNFQDSYTNSDIYFSGSGLNASNENVVSSNTLEFDLDIESYASLDNYTIYLHHWHEWGYFDWTISEPNAFTVFENTAEITSVSPDSVQAGTTETLHIYGYDTNWDGNSQVSINNSYVDINWVNNLSSTELEVEISVDQWAYTGSYDLTVTTGSSFVTLQNGLSITPPDPIEILSIEPESGGQGTNDLILTIEVFNGNFNDSYAGRNVYFSGSGINVQDTWGISDEILQARIDIDTWADLGYHDLTVGISGPWGNGQWQYDTMEEAFKVDSSSHQLLSISPSSSYPSTNDLILTLIGQGTNWSSNSPQLNFNSSSGIYVDWVNAGSDTTLQAQIDISSWASTGQRDVTVTSGSQIVGLQNAFEIKSPEVISLTPSAGVQGAQNLEVTLVAGGVNFYDSYTYINNIYFSGSGLYANNYSVTSESSITFQLDIDNSASADTRDIYLSYESDWNWYEISKQDAFTIIDIDDVENFLTVITSEAINGVETVTVPINLETYQNIEGIQFTISDVPDYLTLSSGFLSVDGYNIITSSNQVTIYYTGGSMIQGGFNDILCELEFNVDTAVINDEVALTFSNIDAGGASITGVGGSVIFGEGPPPSHITLDPESIYYFVENSDSVNTTVLNIGNDGEGTLFWEAEVEYTDTRSREVTFTFTNCGQEGRLGPSQSDCDNEYAGTNVEVEISTEDYYDPYTGDYSSSGIQQWTVPATGIYTIEARGAQGGCGDCNDAFQGGLGARMQGEFGLIAGQTLLIIVGQKGVGDEYGDQEASGGGGSFVVDSNNNPLLIAGGGGARVSNSEWENSDASINENGNSSSNGYEGGSNGYGAPNSQTGGGGGGFYSNGASDYNGCGGGYAFINGGMGGEGCENYYFDGGFGGGGSAGNDAGGGGGGYSGGASDYSGGGGGSYNAGDFQDNESGVNSGHGFVMITGSPWLDLSSSGGYIDPETSHALTLTFNTESLDPGTYSANINFTTNDTSNLEISVPVLLEFPVPQISVTPASIEASIFSGDTSVTSILTINNPGYTDLEWNITVGDADTNRTPIKAVLVADNDYGSFYDSLSYNYLQYGDEQIWVDWQSLSYSSITYNDLVNVDADVLIFTGNDGTVGDSTLDALNQYISEGHGVVAISHVINDQPTKDMLSQWTGIRSDLNYGYNAWWGDYTLYHQVSDHPVLNSLSNPFYIYDGDPIQPHYYNVDGGYEQISWSQAADSSNGGNLIAFGGEQAVIVKENNGFNGVYMAGNIWNDYVNNESDEFQLMYNAICYANGSTANWMSISENTGVLSAGESADIIISYDASNLMADIYTAELQISSNAPDNPSISVPVQLEVIGAPNILVADFYDSYSGSYTPITGLDFGNVFIGEDSTAFTYVVNTGTDDLVVSDILLSDSTNFSVSTDSFVIGPAGSDDLYISFSPQSAGLFSSIMTILSNDPNTPELEFNLYGNGITQAPIIYDIVDVPDDQGGWARLHFLASDIENMGGSYTIFREFPATRDWEIIGSFNPLGDSSYIYLVATLGNATPEDTTYTNYKVSYSEYGDIWYSDAYSGYSIDNIDPAMPTDLLAYFEEATVYLNWAQPIDTDFGYFSIYRDSIEIAQTTESHYEDIPESGELTYYVTANDVNGNESEPSESITVQLTVNQTVQTGFGWNWISFNVNPEDASLSSVLGSVGDDATFITSQSSGTAQNYGDYGWYGALTELDPTQMYKLQMTAAANLVITGVPLDVASTPISLIAGWNWIGYLPQNAGSLDEALVSVGDDATFVSSQSSGTAQNYGDYGWYGALTTLEPGNGYLLDMSEPGELVYPEFSGISRLLSENKQAVVLTDKISDWDFHYGDYEFIGTISASIDSREDFDDDVIGVFVGDECRGLAERMYFPFDDRYFYIIQVYSNITDGENMTFKYYDSTHDEVVEYTESIEFTSDMVVGDGFNTFGLSREFIIPTEFSLERAYPNPFNPTTTIKFGLPEESNVNIAIYNMQGRQVAELLDGYLFEGYHTITWEASQYSSGIYFVKMISGEYISTQKLMLVK